MPHIILDADEAWDKWWEEMIKGRERKRWALEGHEDLVRAAFGFGYEAGLKMGKYLATKEKQDESDHHSVLTK